MAFTRYSPSGVQSRLMGTQETDEKVARACLPGILERSLPLHFEEVGRLRIPAAISGFFSSGKPEELPAYV